jgi:hypothetical protein
MGIMTTASGSNFHSMRHSVCSPGIPHISDVTTAEPPANDPTIYGQTWPHVWKLRRQLEEEVKVADAKKRAREQRAVPSDPSRLAG